jgi:hypothetical protein
VRRQNPRNCWKRGGRTTGVGGAHFDTTRRPVPSTRASRSVHRLSKDRSMSQSREWNVLQRLGTLENGERSANILLPFTSRRKIAIYVMT